MKRKSRREFLRTAGAVGAALGAASYGRVLGANERIAIGMIGCGSRGLGAHMAGEDAFNAAGLSLFPGKSKDLVTDCSCPDWSNPCKHIAAVYYLLGEEFDRDPFLIFKLRGMTRERLITLLGAKAPAQPKPEAASEPAPAAEPLPADAGAFWGADDAKTITLGEVRIPPIAAALPRRLGSFPFWRGGEGFLDAMEAIYAIASPAGLAVLLGERKGGEANA